MKSAVQKLWDMIKGDPVFMRKVNGWLTVFWIVMIPVSLAMGWLSSVVYVSALSLWALVSGHWAAWQAARVEVEQQKEEARDTEGKIARRIIKETNLHKAVDSKLKTASSKSKSSTKKKSRS